MCNLSIVQTGQRHNLLISCIKQCEVIQNTMVPHCINFIATYSALGQHSVYNFNYQKEFKERINNTSALDNRNIISYYNTLYADNNISALK